LDWSSPESLPRVDSQEHPASEIDEGSIEHAHFWNLSLPKGPVPFDPTNVEMWWVEEDCQLRDKARRENCNEVRLGFAGK
jgi:hypothetical protein